MPRVIPVTAGPIAAPAIAVATCERAIGQKACEIRMAADARTVQIPGMTTSQRLLSDASTQAPAGVVINTPATPPTVMTEPIQPLCQPCASSHTPRNGPMPACMSAMKKLSACRERRPGTGRPDGSSEPAMISPRSDGTGSNLGKNFAAVEVDDLLLVALTRMYVHDGRATVQQLRDRLYVCRRLGADRPVSVDLREREFS